MGEGRLLLKDFALGVPLKYTEKEIMAMVPAVWLACWALGVCIAPLHPAGGGRRFGAAGLEPVIYRQFLLGLWSFLFIR